MGQYSASVYKPDPNTLVIGAGGTLDIRAGATLKTNGAQAAAIASLTGAVGAADNAMTAIAAVAAAPADATALATQLNSTTIPAINNDLADLQAKVNAMLAVLRGAGLIAP